MTDTQLIKDKLDIVDFIKEYVQLKSAGINQKGCCPFHQEKTPSFVVNSERQSWHCFGCSKGGDIFSFLQEIEGMDFVEALKFLADKAGVQLEYKASGIDSSQKNRIKDINTEAARFYHNFLIKIPASKPANDYLKERGLGSETIEEWQIGYIRDQWDLLTKYLLKKGKAIDDLVASGLTIKREGADANSQRGFYDRFRGRIMFPLWDVHGSVIGFTGRVLVETERSGGKYVNTPQTIVYDKSKVVFGLNKAKQEIKKKDLIVMVEGQMDVIACHQAGMKNVVATSGTAMTQQQVKLLKRYSNNINMAFDGDSAGQAAVKRGIDLSLQEGMNVRVIIIPEGSGKDPDECIKQDKQIWFDAVSNAKSVMSWYFDKAFLNKDMTDPRQKQNIADKLLAEITLIPHAVEQDHWLRELSSKLNVDVAVLRENMGQVKENMKVKKVNKDKVNGEAREGALGQEKGDIKEIKKSVKQTRLEMLVERLLMVLLKFPEDIELELDILSTTNYLPLYENIKKQYTENSLIDINQLRDSFANENSENLIDLLLMKGDLEFSEFSEDKAEDEIRQLLRLIKKEWVSKRRQEIQRQIEEARKNDDQEELRNLMEEFIKFNI